MSRAERAAAVARLWAEGKLLQREIAETLGISHQYVNQLILDPDGSKVRARKDSYRGECGECGKPTDGSNGRVKAPKLCTDCVPRGEVVWTNAIIVDRIREWHTLYGSPPAMADWDSWKAANRLHDSERTRRFEEADGYWPGAMTLVGRFGSWNAAIEAAGFESRPNHGGGGNQRRRRGQRTKAATT